jgi:hypothetical protein
MKAVKMDKYGIVVLKVVQDRDGLYTATSPQLSGVFVAHRDLDKILDDVPNIMRLWFKRNKGTDIEVFKGPVHHSDGTQMISMVPVPAEIAAQALAR